MSGVLDLRIFVLSAADSVLLLPLGSTSSLGEWIFLSTASEFAVGVQLSFVHLVGLLAAFRARCEARYPSRVSSVYVIIGLTPAFEDLAVIMSAYRS